MTVEQELKFDEAFEKFMKQVNYVFDEYWKTMGFTHEKPTFEVVDGRRYVKVIRVDSTQKSVHLFVDKSEKNFGAVLRSATWKSPAKGNRGNIFSEVNGLEALTPFGAKYL